jgi:hypothetical protein
MDDVMMLSEEIRDRLREEILDKSALWVDLNRRNQDSNTKS